MIYFLEGDIKINQYWLTFDSLWVNQKSAVVLSFEESEIVTISIRRIINKYDLQLPFDVLACAHFIMKYYLLLISSINPKFQIASIIGKKGKHANWAEEKVKKYDIFSANTFRHPFAMVVITLNTSMALIAVYYSFWLEVTAEMAIAL